MRPHCYQRLQSLHRSAAERFLVAEALFIAAKIVRLHCGTLGSSNAAEMEQLLERWFTAEERAAYLPTAA